MIKRIVNNTDELLLDMCDASKGYAFRGNKGVFILARNVDKRFIWVRVTPGKVTTPINAYDTVQEAISDKLETYDVVAYEDVRDLYEL